MQRFFFGICLLSLCHAFVCGGEIKFNRDIRPIFSSNCFQCHGPDHHSRKADLRLDIEEGLQTVFAAKNLAESEAWRRIISTDDDERMPPLDSHLELKADEKQLIKEWIEQGTPWEGHWSFIAPTRPDIPKTKSTWGVNPIDRFVLSKLKDNHLSPSPEAALELLLRRVTFDLTGLPPTVDEIDRFLNDKSDTAYERVVDRLLQSKHFGERMTLVWMDLSRYGDTSVFHADGPRDMWPWRDWVINAYNENKPFDKFTKEQLAGDLLPNPTPGQVIASGFNRNNATTDEGGAIAEEFRIEYAVDRVQTTGLVWMALSIQCAQCHDHKYDPITQKEYYEFFAYFNQAADPGMQTRGGNQAPVVNVFDPAKQKQAQELKPRLAELDAKILQRRTEQKPGFQKWLVAETTKHVSSPLPSDNLVLYCSLDSKPDGTKIQNLASDQFGTLHGKHQDRTGYLGKAIRVDKKTHVEFVGAGDFERSDAFSCGAWVRPAKNSSGAVLAKMNTGNSHRGYDLLVDSKNGSVSMHLVHKWPENAIKVTAQGKLEHDQWHHVLATYDGSGKATGAKIYIDGELQKVHVDADKLTDTIKSKTHLAIGRRSGDSQLEADIDEVRVYSRTLSDDEVKRIASENKIDRLLVVDAKSRTEDQQKQLQDHYLFQHDDPFVALTKERTDLQNQVSEMEKPISTVMVMKDVEKPRMTYVLDRGSYDSPKKDQPLLPSTLSALPAPPEGAPQNRLGMAEWLVHPDHPLTARVAVNRYWFMLFGNGIVKSIDEFGAQGEWPSHPQLLDWLAVDFVENGWDIKRTIKQMVMSATYRQSSKTTSELLAKDPENRLLARGPRFRLAGEFIRDSALSSSGLLVPTIGGPSVKPYQPPGLWNDVSINTGLRFKQDKGEKLYRRSMYTYWKRSAPAPSLTIFDTPSREKCVVKRSRTNTPLQALVTLNDVQFVEASRALAERAMTNGGKSAEAWVNDAFRLATGTRPNPTTLKMLVESFAEEKAIFVKNPARAIELLSAGESKRNEGLDQAQHAAMTVIASIILNLDQTLTRG